MISALIIGAGRFGAMLVQQMAQLNYEVMVVDSSEDRSNAIMPYVTDAQIGDSTNPAFIRTLG
jgi:trk system potassium uptake protein TrkA